MEQQMNEKIIEIVHQANNMIPVEWDDLYIVIEMDKTYSGEAYFYFKYKKCNLCFEALTSPKKLTRLPISSIFYVTHLINDNFE